MGRGLLTYSPDLVPEIVAFQQESYPRRDPGLIEPRWRWMFERSAARLGVPPMVWVYRTASKVVAHQGAIAVRCKLGDQTLVTGWFVETMVHESYRGKAVGPMMVKKALEDMPFNLSLGQTQQMREMQLALGWVRVGGLPIAILPVRASRVMAGKGSALVRPFAALALSAQRTLGMLATRSSMTGVEIEEDGSLSEEHDELWGHVARDVQAAVVRDRSFLEWKYREQPGQQFVTLNVRRGSRLLGFVGFAIRQPDQAYRYTRAVVTDILVPPSDTSALSVCIRALYHVARRHGADLISAAIRQPAIQRRLARHGFRSRPHERLLLVASGPDGHPVRRWVDQPDEWLLTMSDSDIDRP